MRLWVSFVCNTIKCFEAHPMSKDAVSRRMNGMNAGYFMLFFSLYVLFHKKMWLMG